MKYMEESIFLTYQFRCYDLFNDRGQLLILEDKNNNVVVQNLSERDANSQAEMIQLIELGNNVRSTYATTSND